MSTLLRRATVAAATVLTGALLAACSAGLQGAAPAATSGDLSDVTLTFGFQTADYPELLKASGKFEDLPYTLETPVISGPAQQIAALNSRATDVGLVGENTAAFEADNADEDWSATEPRVYTIAGVSAPQAPNPSPSLFVRKSAGITSLAGLRGKKVAYNFGGNIYAGYVKVLADAGLTVNDIEPVQLPDNQAAAAAFVAGKVDAVVSGYAQVKQAVDAGDAVRLATNVDLGVEGGAGFITRADVLKDPAKVEAIRDFFSRFSSLYRDWYPNNEAAVTGVYQSVLKQSPELAKINFDNGAVTRFYKIGDPAFVARQQAVADAAFAAGGVKHKRDVSVVFNPIIDPQTVPAS
ncbi:ABC transporter substrate-binding protein [Pseudonocardia endophytica]|uniref:ABC transporter substrate-binding protein n=1 Tax=Pseudonocardia endophytica TaxID=401976 RepID=UPI00104745DF|nr:ABC transporter substrate-binding protein [Pseudonocardia endophytica]